MNSSLRVGDLVKYDWSKMSNVHSGIGSEWDRDVLYKILKVESSRSVIVETKCNRPLREDSNKFILVKAKFERKLPTWF